MGAMGRVVNCSLQIKLNINIATDECKTHIAQILFSLVRLTLVSLQDILPAMKLVIE